MKNVENVGVLAEEGGWAPVKVKFLGETMEEVEGNGGWVGG